MTETKEKRIVGQKLFRNSMTVDGRQIRYKIDGNGMSPITGTFRALSDSDICVSCSLSIPERTIRIDGILIGSDSGKERFDFHKVMIGSGIINGMLRFANLNRLDMEVPRPIKELIDNEKARMKDMNVGIMDAGVMRLDVTLRK
jgi:hypothetical protein